MDQQKNNNIMAVFVLGGLFLFMMITLMGGPIRGYLIKINFYTLLALNYILNSSEINSTLTNIRSIPQLQEVTWGDTWTLTSYTGSFFRWPMIPPLLLWVFYLWRRDPVFKYKRRLTIKHLVEKNAHNFFSVRPVVGEDFLNPKHYVDDWRPMTSPLQFALDHELFLIENKSAKEVKAYIENLNKKRRNMDAALVGDYQKALLDEKRMREVLERQTGTRIWDKEDRPVTKSDVLGMLMKMPRHERALAVVLMCHYLAERNLKVEGDKLLEQYADSYWIEKLKKAKKKKTWSVDALNTAGVDLKIRSILDTYDFDILIIPFLFHAWSHTLLISLFYRVKTITSADFIWLKPVDRCLWYIMNTVGRKTPCAEAAGAFAHYNVEVGMGRPCLQPDVDGACIALQEYLILEGWVVDPENAT